MVHLSSRLHEINVLNKSLTPPFVVDDKEDVNEDLRLRYRYLDLRRDYMKRNMEFRHKVVEQIRRTEYGFDFFGSGNSPTNEINA